MEEIIETVIRKVGIESTEANKDIVAKNYDWALDGLKRTFGKDWTKATQHPLFKEALIYLISSETAFHFEEYTYKYDLYYRLYTSDFREIKNGIDNC